MRLTLPLLMLAVVVVATGCAPSVESINANPQKYAGRTVEIEGIVKKVVSVPSQENTQGMTLYQVSEAAGDDESRMIWVIRGADSAQKAMPNPNHRITLTGVVEAERKIRNTTYAPVIVEASAEEEIPPEGPASF